MSQIAPWSAGTVRDYNHASHGIIEVLPKGAIPFDQAAQCILCGARNRQLRDAPCSFTSGGGQG